MSVNKMKGLVLSLALVVMALIMFPIVLDSVFDATTDPQTDSFPGCVVAGGATDVVLTEDLLDANVIYVSEITATGAGAVPVANTYTAGTNTLNVTGLGVDTPQDLTVTYSYDAVVDYTGVGAFSRIVPLFVLIGLVVAAIFNTMWTIKRE